jgi:hypothetical protein
MIEDQHIRDTGLFGRVLLIGTLYFLQNLRRATTRAHKFARI